MLKDRMDADDITQEVLIKIWKNIHNVNPFAAKSWIMKTTNNLCIDYLRKKKSERVIPINEEIENSLETETIEHNPYLRTHINMVSSIIKELIQQLPENLRSVFVLYEIQGLKYREISNTLEIPINSVKVYLLRARKKLQEELKEYATQEVL
jgi:RNA polymerase sigma-70 factor, ECF subfamily